MVVTAGQRHETIAFTDLMDAVSVPQPRGRPRKRPEAVAGDRAYDADWIRQWCRDRGIESVIPARSQSGPGRPPTWDDRKSGRRNYERRNTVERLVGHLKERRRLVVRYEKKASRYKAMLLWAFVREYLTQLVTERHVISSPGLLNPRITESPDY